MFTNLVAFVLLSFTSMINAAMTDKVLKPAVTYAL